jgi:hypothetical protein
MAGVFAIPMSIPNAASPEAVRRAILNLNSISKQLAALEKSTSSGALSAQTQPITAGDASTATIIENLNLARDDIGSVFTLLTSLRQGLIDLTLFDT